MLQVHVHVAACRPREEVYETALGARGHIEVDEVGTGVRIGPRRVGVVVAHVCKIAPAQEGVPICLRRCVEVHTVAVDLRLASKSLEVRAGVVLVWGQVASAAATYTEIARDGDVSVHCGGELTKTDARCVAHVKNASPDPTLAC